MKVCMPKKEYQEIAAGLSMRCFLLRDLIKPKEDVLHLDPEQLVAYRGTEFEIRMACADVLAVIKEILR
jgi:hypothetical protein